MLLFSTMLDVNDSLTKEGFVDVILEWNNTGSRAANVIPGIEWNDSFGVRFGSDSLWLRIDECPKAGIVAARHEKTGEDGTVWRTDYVMNFFEMKMAVRLDRSYREGAIQIDADFSTPHFISLLIGKGYLRNDANLPVLREVTVVGEGNEELAVGAVAELGKYALPLVFVPRAKGGGYPLDVGLLASKLKGAAHVFAEGDRDSSAVAAELFGQGESVAIHFPSQPAKPMVISLFEGEDKRVLLAKVLRPAVQYSNSKVVDPLYTWEGVRNEILLDSLVAQHEKALRSQREADDANEFVDEFMVEHRALEEELRRLEGRAAALEAELAALRVRKGEDSSGALLVPGSEHDFFDGEIKDLVLSTLVDALKRIHPSTRRHDVVSDVVESNGYQGLCERRAAEMEKLLKSSNPTSERFEQGLKKLGFETKNNRRHLKARYYGDERYLVVFPKTPSDIRAAANDAANAVRTAF